MRCGEHRLIFDAGTGLRKLGCQMVADGEPVRSHLFFTHTHMDHVLGLPFFRPAYDKRNSLEFWSGHLRSQGRRLEDVLDQLMQTPYFPVPLDIMHACIAFHDFQPGDPIAIGNGIAIRTVLLNHPGGAVGYRVEFAGRSACYVTDTEHVPGQPDQAILNLIQGADLVIYDSTYTDEEFPRLPGLGPLDLGRGHPAVRRGGCAASWWRSIMTPTTTMPRWTASRPPWRRGGPARVVAREGMVITL